MSIETAFILGGITSAILYALVMTAIEKYRAHVRNETLRDLHRGQS